MCDNCGCGSSATMMNISVTSAMDGVTSSSPLGIDNSDMPVQSAPQNTIGN
jgi:hypothetical protein